MGIDIFAKYGEARLQRFRELHAQGLSDKQIYEHMPEFGCFSTVGNVRRRLQLPPNFGTNKEDITERLRELHAQGLSDKQIGAALRLSEGTIAVKRQRLRLPKNHEIMKKTPVVDKSCQGCFYLGVIYGAKCCEYCIITGALRPCQPGEGCTEYYRRQRRRYT